MAERLLRAIGWSILLLIITSIMLLALTFAIYGLKQFNTWLFNVDTWPFTIVEGVILFIGMAIGINASGEFD